MTEGEGAGKPGPRGGVPARILAAAAAGAKGVAGAFRRTVAAFLAFVTGAARDRKPLLFAGAVGALAAVVVAVLVLVSVLGGGRGSDAGTTGSPERAPAVGAADRDAKAADGEAAEVPEKILQSPASVLRELRMPAGASADVPLDRLPKGVYTVDDALAVMPELGAIDRSRLTARRKARIEALFGSVD